MISEARRMTRPGRAEAVSARRRDQNGERVRYPRAASGQATIEEFHRDFWFDGLMQPDMFWFPRQAGSPRRAFFFLAHWRARFSSVQMTGRFCRVLERRTGDL